MDRISSRAVSKYVTLNNGRKMPRFGLGTFTHKNKDAIKASITDLGYRYLDTALRYDNEHIVGEAVREADAEGVSREEIFVSTKLWRTDFSDPVKGCTESLERLGLDYVDMYLIHVPTPDWDLGSRMIKRTPMHEVWRGMEECVEQGLTKSIGISNFNIQTVTDMLAYANIPPACNQVELHPYYQNRDLMRFSEMFDIKIVSYGTLTAPDRARGSTARNVLEDPVIRSIADQHNISPAQVALAWNLQLGNIVIAKTDILDLAQENIESLSITLSEADMDAIASIDADEKIYNPADWEDYGFIDIFK